jgi:hypothetical protein
VFDLDRSRRFGYNPSGMTESARAGAHRRWRLPIRRPPDAEHLVAPWWLPSLFLLFAVVLAPWIIWLFVTLPSQEVANHWEIAWGGFDIALAVFLGGTGVALARRSPSAEILAAMTAAILLCDAWFDTMTSRGSTTLALAIAEAVCVELPLAILCLWIARNIERVVSDARPFLELAGFRIENRRLVPPEDRPAD